MLAAVANTTLQGRKSVWNHANKVGSFGFSKATVSCHYLNITQTADISGWNLQSSDKFRFRVSQQEVTMTLDNICIVEC
jgi:hypothetical protein